MQAELPRHKASWIGWVVAAAFFALFLALRTNNFTSVDGALRCLGVFFKGERFHDNNHLLYPFWVGMWAEASGLFGLHAQDAFQFIRLTQAMNALSGAASVGFLYYLIDSIAGMRPALLGSLMFGFSTAVTLQSTSSDEAMVGLFFALLAMVILAYGIKNSTQLAIFLAGFCMSVALASYEAMGTVVGIAILMCWFWPVSDSVESIPVMRRVLLTALGGAVGVMAVYGWAYASQGIPVSKMPAEFLSLGGSPEVYASPAQIPKKAANVPFGLVYCLFAGIPDDYAGVRSLLHHSHSMVWLAGSFFGFLWILAAFLLASRGWRARVQRITPFEAALLVVAGLFITFPVWYWGPLYYKLWLLPLACILFALTVPLGGASFKSRQRQILVACLLACLAVEVARRLPFMIHEHFGATPWLAEARKVAATIGPDDWVVLDFDDVSMLWGTIWGHHTKSLLLPSSKVATASEWLDEAKAACRSGRSKLYFVGVLQQDRVKWDAFLGSRVGIPFSFLDEYRKDSRLVLRLQDSGSFIEVSQFIPPQ